MKKLTMIVTATIFTASCFSVTLYSCKKDLLTPSCYDRDLEAKHKNDFCTMDCPGVTGCDGKTYCNGCEAARHGIRTVK